jgi:hypothetical protein
MHPPPTHAWIKGVLAGQERRVKTRPTVFAIQAATGFIELPSH